MSHFPFSAVVGSDDLARALVLAAVEPAVGGVLVRGEKGTAKSTSVRALTSLLPEVAVVEGCRFSCDPAAPDPRCPDAPHSGDSTSRPARLVELPVGAAEDRVVGSLDLARVLGAGETSYEPGLLAAAHRGLLYVDEVNLLHDHLVDLLLDAAAEGRTTVERDAVSLSHASRFVLVGTMNPEEGELRPQLLDRFGLSVDVAAPRDPAVRAEVVRRRLAYDADPAAFVARWREQETLLAERILKARAFLPAVLLPDAALTKIAEVCAAFGVDGMRADLVMARAAIAHAAWCERSEVTRGDIRVAALLALPHRRRRTPFDEPGLDEDLLDRILGDDEPEPPRPPEDEVVSTSSTNEDRSPHGAESAPRDSQEPSTTAESAPRDTSNGEPSADSTRPGADSTRPGADSTGAGVAYRTRRFAVAGAGAGEAGRRSRAVTDTGRTVGHEAHGRRGGPVHLAATVRAAALDAGTSRVVVRAEHLRTAVREGRESNLVLLCVDASGSMAARTRMEQVKTAVLSLLVDAYQRRDKVGLVTFRGDRADVVLPPTGSVDLAVRRLEALPAGGRTPLAEGLAQAAEVLRVERLRDPKRRPLLVVVTDGRATSGADAVARSLQAARHLAGVSSVVVDCETGRMRMGLAVRLAQALGAEHVPVGEVSADALTTTIRTRRAA